MDRRFQLRRDRLLADCHVSDDAFDGVAGRLESFAEPRAVKHQTRRELALEMLAGRGSPAPHGWIAGDDQMGRPAWFRDKLRELGERHLLAAPSNTTVRDLEEVIPPQVRTGSGRAEQRGPRKTPFAAAASWCESQPARAWTSIEVRDADKGSIVVDAIQRRVEAKENRRVTGREELLFATRQASAAGGWKYDYHLSNAPAQTPLTELPRVREALALILHRRCGCSRPPRIVAERIARLRRNERARSYHPRKRKRLPPLKLRQPLN